MDKNEYMQRLAKRNLVEKDAKHFEPRLFFDSFVFDGQTARVFSQPDVYRNGEKFPFRVTHLSASMLFTSDELQNPVGGDERMIQRYSMRIRAHGVYYQNSDVTPIPLWANKPVAAADVTTLSQSCWRFDKPFILGNRDTFQVEVSLIVAPDTDLTERVAVTFAGLGLYSRMPKILTSEIDLADTLVATMDTNDFRNDGTEPLEVTHMVVHHTPSVEVTNPVGNIRNVKLRVRANGNGTNQWWNWTAVSAATQLVPAQLFGLTTGRSVVHELPGDGWLWYPNEGVTVEVESQDTSRRDTVLIAMAGYIMVT